MSGDDDHRDVLGLCLVQDGEVRYPGLDRAVRLDPKIGPKIVNPVLEIGLRLPETRSLVSCVPDHQQLYLRPLRAAKQVDIGKACFCQSRAIQGNKDPFDHRKVSSHGGLV